MLYADIGADLVKPYKVNNQMIDQSLELKHGSACKTWNMDKVSNSPFTLVRACCPTVSNFFNLMIVVMVPQYGYRKSLSDS